MRRAFLALYWIACLCLGFGLAMLLDGCNQPPPTPDFFSPCGVRVYGSQDSIGYALTEARCLASFRAVEPRLCQRVRNWSVSIGYSDLGGRQEQVWVDLLGVQLAQDDWSGIPHAMGHVVQYPGIDYEHTSWPDAGITAAIEEATR